MQRAYSASNAASTFAITTPKGCGHCGRDDVELTRWYGDGGSLAISHGFYSMWCKRCVHRAQLVYAVKESWQQLARLPKLLALVSLGR